MHPSGWSDIAMCGIAGAMDLTGAREFSVPTAPRDDRRDRPSRARRRADPHRAGGGAGCPAAVDHRPGRRPSADRQRGRHDLGRLQRRALRVPRAAAASCSRAAITWRPVATPRRGSISTKTMARGCSSRARGQFAVSLWDRRNRTLILGRDRVGICPLYYTEVDGWLLWGSEIKALLASGLVAGPARSEGDRPLLQLLLRPARRGRSFEGIKIAPAGPFPQGRDGRVTQQRYWDLDFPDAGHERRLDDPTPLVDELEALLRQAVERRLRGDVPVVSYISGGLDSTVVLGLSSRQRGKPCPSFTIGLDSAGPDERTAVDRVGRRAGLATDDGHDGSVEDIAAAYPELDARGRGTGARYVVRLPPAAGADGAPAGVQGRPHRRRGRRGAGRLRLVQVAEDPQCDSARRFGTVPPNVASTAHPPLDRRRSVAVARPTPDRRRSPRPARPLRHPRARRRTLLYSNGMWDRLGDHSAYDDLEITSDANRALASAQPVALRRLQGDAGRSAPALQGGPHRHECVGRDALSVPRRRCDLVLRGDRSGIQAARDDRQVAPAAGGRADLAAADRQPAQDDVSRQHVRHVPGRAPAGVGRPAPQPRVAPRDRATSIPSGSLTVGCLRAHLPADHAPSSSGST